MSQPIDYRTSSPPASRPQLAPGTSTGLMLAGPLVWFLPAVMFVLLVSVFTGLIIPIIGSLDSADSALGAVAAYFPASLLALGVAYAINHVLRIRRRQRARIILGYVENCVRLNLPLDPFLMAAEASETGRASRNIYVLRQNLGRGMPVGEALRLSVPDLPEDQIAEISAAERLGRLAPTLSRIVEETVHEQPSAQNDLAPFYRLYPLGLFAFISLLLLGYLFFIVPKFQEIFRDFRTALPWSTVLVIRTADFFLNDMWPVSDLLLVAILPTITALVGLQLARMFTPWWPRLSLAALRDRAAWWLPVWRQAERNRGMAGVCRLLADGVRAGLTLPQCLEEVAGLRMNRFLKHQLDTWRILTVNGAAPQAAAAQAGMPRLLVGFLDSLTGPRGGGSRVSQPEMFDFLARYYADRAARAFLFLRASLVPVSVLVAGSAVGFFVYSMFSPLTALLNGVMGTPPQGYWI